MVCTQRADLLSTKPDSTTPSPIQRELQRYCDAQKACKEQERVNAQGGFEAPWLQLTEKDLHDCTIALLSADLDGEKKAFLEAYEEVLQDKLKNHHHNVGFIGCKIALGK